MHASESGENEQRKLKKHIDAVEHLPLISFVTRSSSLLPSPLQPSKPKEQKREKQMKESVRKPKHADSSEPKQEQKKAEREHES